VKKAPCHSHLTNALPLHSYYTGSVGGTLLSVLDHCSTPFGRRRLRQWLCRPLFRVSSPTWCTLFTTKRVFVQDLGAALLRCAPVAVPPTVLHDLHEMGLAFVVLISIFVS
jgi:hypothetical protein